ncbi:MAG: sodium:solute symporter family protein [Candidatus Methanomethyliaceae archaeon]|nr:sodium:solute symporter family protein [Candidatus Methanomethyliaceae archaeon]
MISVFDAAIIFAYLMTVFAVGVIYRRVNSSYEYMTAGGRIGLISLYATWSATAIGAGFTMGIIGNVYRLGVSGAWTLIAFGIGFATVYFLIPRVRYLGERYRFTTLPEMMGARMGRGVQILAGLVTVAGISGFIADNFVGLGTIFKVYLGLDLWLGILIAATVTASYTVIGGQLAVIRTDLIQWVMAILGIVFIVLPLALARAGGLENIFSSIPPSRLTFESLSIYSITGVLTSMIFGVQFQNHLVQRQLAARDKKVLYSSTILANVTFFLWAAVCIIIGLAGAVAFPGLPSAQSLLPLMINELVPYGLNGLVIASLLSIMMSSVDSFLIGVSSSLSKDIISALFPRMDDIKILRVTKISALFITLLSISIALIYPDILGLILAFFSTIASGLGVPVIATLFWKRATPYGIGAGIIAGSLIALYLRLTGSIFDPSLVGVPVSLIATVALSLLTKPQPTGIIDAYFHKK